MADTNFDTTIRGLFEDPLFQFGLSTLGQSRNPNAIPQALAALQNVKKIQQEKAYQNAQIEQTKEARRIQQEQYERQLAADTAKEKRQSEADARQQAFIDRISNSGIFGPSGQAPANPTTIPAPAAAPEVPQSAPGALGKFGTPAALLDNLYQIESSGNPRAINPESKAMGGYQFLPSTVKMLKDQGTTFDPFNPEQSRDAADKYIQTLVQQNGGDYKKALAQYGGFKTKDPSSYVGKVLQNVELGGQPAPQQQAPIGGQQQGPSGLVVGRIGALASLQGLKGGAQLLELGKMLQDKNVPAGSYQQNQQTGQLTYVPNPQDTIKNAQEAEKIALETQRTNATVAKETQGLTEKKANDLTGYQESANSLDRLKTNAQALLNHPGLPVNTGATGAAKLYQVTQNGRDANALLDTIKSQLTVETLAKLKATAKNGSSGFGQLSDKEGEILQNYIVNLRQSQSLPAVQKALKDIIEFSDKSKSTLGNHIKSVYGKDATSPPSTLPGGWSVKEK